MDMGYIGPKFSWSNRQNAEMNTRVRLDRAVANGDFLQKFDNCTVENIITTSSGHFAILITMANSSDPIVINPVQLS